MGLSFPISVVLLILEAVTVVVFMLMTRSRRSAQSADVRRLWRLCFLLTTVLAAFPALLAVVELTGELFEGVVSSATIKPFAFLVLVLLFPPLALRRLVAAR